MVKLQWQSVCYGKKNAKIINFINIFQLALTLDGVEEGASLLFEGLLEIYKHGEQQDLQRGQLVKDSDSLKSAANENAAYVNETVPGNTSPLHGAEGTVEFSGNYRNKMIFLENRMRAQELEFVGMF